MQGLSVPGERAMMPHRAHFHHSNCLGIRRAGDGGNSLARRLQFKSSVYNILYA